MRLPRHQLGSHPREDIKPACGEPGLDGYRLPFDIAEFPQSIAERVQEMGVIGPGKTPMQTFLGAIPLAREEMIVA